MKKSVIAIISMAMLTLASCSQKKPAETPAEQQAAIDNASREELSQAVSDRDELLSLVGEIQQGLTDIKQLESIMTSPQGETPSQRAQIKADIAAIQQALVDRRARLEELEKKLASSNIYSTQLQETIKKLQAQIDSQTAEIERLNGELGNAKQQIANLDQKVDSLNTTVSTVTEERNTAQQETAEAVNRMNTCYYVIGTNKELKAHKIVESGFLRKTKIMPGDFDSSYFTTADKRTLTTINLYSTKGKVLTSQPADSYTISDVNGKKVLTITNPNKFWSVSNYLVIEI